MHYRKMGNTGQEVSALGFGCMRLPVIDNNPAMIDEEKAINMVRHAIDKGVNYIDTAYPYHGTGMGGAGESEPFVAKALKDGYREKVSIATKLPTWLVRSREDMDKYLDEQLKRLETDCIDYYLIHTLNAALWGMIQNFDFKDFLDQAIKDGKIKYAGFSFHDTSVELFKEIVDAYDWSFCQIQYNYMDRDQQAGEEGLDYAAKKGLGVVIMEPLRGGSLATNLPDSAESLFQNGKPQRSAADWSLRWLWNDERVGVVLSGMSEMDHVVGNLKTASESSIDSMSKDELNTIEEVTQVIKSKVKVGCTACGYCMPCPVGVNIPECFARYNDYYRYDSLGAKRQNKMMYTAFMAADEKADKCVECGKCEEHCPQGIQIIKELKNVHSELATELPVDLD